MDSKQHSELVETVKRGLQDEHGEPDNVGLAALASLVEQLEAAEKEREQAYVTAQAMNEAQFEASVKVTELKEQLEALRNFNAATRAAYATLNNSSGVSSDPPEDGGVGPGPLDPASNPASEPEAE